MRIELRAAVDADLDWLVELRAEVMRDDLTRLGRFDPERVRQRLRDEFVATNTRIVVVDGADAGSIAVRPAADGDWIEHIYLRSELQGRGIGGRVLERVLHENPRARFRLDVLQGSPARRLYERHGFVVESEDAVDVIMARYP